MNSNKMQIKSFITQSINIDNIAKIQNIYQYILNKCKSVS